MLIKYLLFCSCTNIVLFNSLMAVFEKEKNHTETKVMVKLLTKLSESPESTQRDLATEMGISLGMMVNYMKSCVKKGFIRTKQISPKRWAYFVTPKGFSEKSAMVSKYLYRSMTFFRDTREQIEEVFRYCENKKIKNIAIVGDGDVSEIAVLVSHGFSINLETVEVENIEKIKSFDAVLVTSTKDPQGTFDFLKEHILDEKLLSIEALCISRKRISKVFEK